MNHFVLIKIETRYGVPFGFVRKAL